MKVLQATTEHIASLHYATDDRATLAQPVIEPRVIPSPIKFPVSLTHIDMSEKITKTFLSCDRCGFGTVHSMLCSADSDVEYVDADGYCNSEPAVYRMFRCDGCLQISLYARSNLHSPSSDFGERQYPDAVGTMFLPDTVNAAYIEANKLARRSSLAYGVMVRRLLEAVVEDRQVQSRNLSTSLVRLGEKEQLSPELVKALALLRSLGNLAAHDTNKSLNASHSQATKHLIDALLAQIYIVPSEIELLELTISAEVRANSA